jgi:hypothetical protein
LDVLPFANPYPELEGRGVPGPEDSPNCLFHLQRA